MRVIETPTLTLEPQVAAHADEMFAVLCDPAIYEHESAPPPSIEWLRERYRRLETRCSADGREEWLNWVIRLPSCEPIGYVQATVHADGRAAGLRTAATDRGIAPSASCGDSRSLAPPGLRRGPRLAARADIAYVLASRYWGRGLARAAVEAMIGELVARHGVRTLSAVLKRTNARSLRLLERLGFALAPSDVHDLREIEPGEILMLRDARCA